MTALLSAIAPQQLTDILQQAGFRANLVDNNGVPQIHSASQGIAFVIGFGNSSPQVAGSYSDFALNCLLQIEGELNPELVASWNRSRRFARVSQQGPWLVLTLDVLVAGGVSPAWLRGQFELWDAILREYVRHLQTPMPAATIAPVETTAPAAALTETATEIH